MAEAAFQFHCMICYEEFENSPTRHPVVLPCGHTYVCKTCGDRLDKCMECREPLFIKVPPEHTNSPVPAVASNGSRATASWSTSANRRPATNQHTSPKKVNPQPLIKKRLPLPKNAVLLSLIEATRMISANTQPAAAAAATTEEDVIIGASTSRDSSVMDEYHEEDPVHVELAAAVSAGKAGTYAVSAREGLKIFPHRPDTTSITGSTLHRSNVSFTDEDVSTLVDFFHEQKVDQQGESKPKELLATLAYGDRIQVVSIDEGWAKLARGYGYVEAANNSIVKVGNPIDRSCILEAMLRTVSDRRRELRKKQSENDTQFIKLMNQLQNSLHGDEDLTVICKSVFKEATQEESFSENISAEDSIIEEAIPLGRVNSSIQHKGSWWCDPMVETTLAPIEQNVPHAFPGAPKSGLVNSTPPSPSRMLAGAQAWRERQGREVRKSIDFRTGMSGHKAALSSQSHSHPHDFLNTPERSAPNVTPPPRKTGLLKMSTHSGLTFKSSSKKKTGGFGPISWSGSH